MTNRGRAATGRRETQLCGTSGILGKLVFAGALVAATTGCDVTGGKDGLYYIAPASASRIAGEARLSSPLADAADKLAAAGLKVDTSQIASGIIRGTSNGNELIECGTLVQRARGNVATFPASTYSAAIFRKGEPVAVRRRTVEVLTEFEVRQADASANRVDITEQFEVTLRYLSADGRKVVMRDMQSFDGRKVARFRDGTSCRSAGAIEAIIGQ